MFVCAFMLDTCVVCVCVVCRVDEDLMKTLRPRRDILKQLVEKKIRVHGVCVCMRVCARARLHVCVCLHF